MKKVILLSYEVFQAQHLFFYWYFITETSTSLAPMPFYPSYGYQGAEHTSTFAKSARLKSYVISLYESKKLHPL